MKIIEGTPEEIREYQNQITHTPTIKTTQNPSVNTAEYKRGILKNRAKVHWSHTKSEWVSINQMNPSHIMNVLRHKLEDISAKELIEDDDEFISLILNLGDKLVEEKF